MDDFYSYLILFSVGFISSLLNVFAGGGSSLTLPLLIFLGLDTASANGTNRIGILLQNVSAIYSFKKEKYHKFNTSLRLSAATLPGAIAGALVAVRVSDEFFQTILGIIMIGIVLSMIIPGKKEYPDYHNDEVKWYSYAAMVFVGFYGGFIQVGVGFIIMAALHYLINLNLIYVNMHKVFIVFVFTVPALIIFILTDNVNWKLGIILAAGNALGGWWAAKFSVKKGEKVIRIILAAAVFIMSLKLLDVF